jgi:group I intron endonuclease
MAETVFYYIYKITCAVNNKIYIGQTCSVRRSGIRVYPFDPIKRLRQHISMAKKKRKDTIKFHEAIKVHGAKNFSVETLCKCPTPEDANEKETHFIALFDSVKNGYNIQVGGRNYIRGSNESLSEHAKKRWKKEGFRESVVDTISTATRASMWKPKIREALMKSMAALRKAAHLPQNIYEVNRAGVLKGYLARIDIDGSRYEKQFSGAAYELEEYLKMACDYLENVKHNVKIPTDEHESAVGLSAAKSPILNGRVVRKRGKVQRLDGNRSSS